MRLLFLLCLLTGIVGCSPQLGHPLEQKESVGFIQVVDRQVLATNLVIPWAITKVDEVFYVTERTGTIAKIENGTLTREHVQLTQDIVHVGEGGLLGFVLDPNHKQNGQAYLYHTYRDQGQVLNRVVTVERQDTKWVETSTLIDQIKGDRFHHGGRILIGPDGKLYITTGDALEEGLSQDPHDLAGKILRLELDGSIPTDNPNPDSPIYTLGHRNPQGLAWNETGEEMYSSEHGPRAHDEINRIEPGLNYGWPEIIGAEDQDNMETPLFHSGDDTWAPSGMIYYEGKLYIAALRGSMILGFDLERKTQQVIWDGEGRIRDIFLEGNKLYIVTNNTDGRGTPSAEDDRLIALTFTQQ